MSLTLILSIAVFLGIVLLLVALLLWVRNKLMPKGKVKITINGDKELEVQPGSSLIVVDSTTLRRLGSAPFGNDR